MREFHVTGLVSDKIRSGQVHVKFRCRPIHHSALRFPADTVVVWMMRTEIDGVQDDPLLSQSVPQFGMDRFQILQGNEAAPDTRIDS